MFNIFQFVEICYIDLVFLEQINYQGMYFGGVVMVVMDKVVFLVFVCYVCWLFVIVFCDCIDFCNLVYVGNMIELLGQVCFVGWFLFVVDVEFVVEDLCIGEWCICMCGVFIMVVVDCKINLDCLFLVFDVKLEFVLLLVGFVWILCLVFLGDINYLGQLFGGGVMLIMGKVVYIVVVWYICCEIGMVVLDKIDFIVLI